METPCPVSATGKLNTARECRWCSLSCFMDPRVQGRWPSLLGDVPSLPWPRGMSFSLRGAASGCFLFSLRKRERKSPWLHPPLPLLPAVSRQLLWPYNSSACAPRPSAHHCCCSPMRKRRWVPRRAPQGPQREPRSLSLAGTQGFCLVGGSFALPPAPVALRAPWLLCSVAAAAEPRGSR